MPLYQNEAKCSAFDMKMIFHSHANKTHFHKNGCALRGFSELGSGLLPYDVVLIPKNSSCNTVSASTCMVMQIKLVVVLR